MCKAPNHLTRVYPELLGGSGGSCREVEEWRKFTTECWCCFWPKALSHVSLHKSTNLSVLGEPRECSAPAGGTGVVVPGSTETQHRPQGALPSPLGSPGCKELLRVKNLPQTLQIQPVPVQPRDKSGLILCNYAQPQRRRFMRALIGCSAPTKRNNVIFQQCWGLI